MTRIMEYYGISNKEAWELRAQRRAADLAVSSYVELPISFGPQINEVYEVLTETENLLIPNRDYSNGSAAVENSIVVVPGANQVLLTAEHATNQVRDSNLKDADFGTGALAHMVARTANQTAIIANGKQTSDANYEPIHPLKEAMVGVMADERNKAHLALHLLYRGRASQPKHKRSYSVVLGIGKKPSEATMELKDQIVESGKDLGLKMVINKPYVIFNKNKQLKFNSDGSVKKITFAAAGPNTTRSFSQATAEKLGKQVFAAIQLEINEVLLVGQEVSSKKKSMDFPTQFDRELGAFIGYHFTKMATEAAAKL
jgi:hypothetical protein